MKHKGTVGEVPSGQESIKIMLNERDTPLKRDLIECIRDLPDEILIALKPLLYMLIENTNTIETVSLDELSDEEKAAIQRGRAEYELGETVRLEDIDWT